MKTNITSMYPDTGGYRIVDQYATYFLTLTIVGWVDLFTRLACRNILLESLNYCQLHKGLILNAYVVMGNHLHLMAKANQNSNGLSAVLRDFKRATAKELLKWVRDNPKESRRDWIELIFKYHGKYNSNNEIYQVWKKGNCPKVCFSPEFTLQKLNYIHNNPVVAGIVDNPCDYKCSSARNYAGRDDYLLHVDVLEFWLTMGYVM